MSCLEDIQNFDNETDIDVIKNVYNCITNDAVKYHDLFENYDELLKLQNISANPRTEEHLKLKNSNHTTKRQIEINNNKRHRNQYRNRYLKYILLVVVLLTIFPILGKFDVIPKPVSALIIFICLVVIVIFIIFVFFIKDINRDINNFNEYNFHKPDDSQIARSRTNLKISDSDRAKCDSLAELNEDIDPSNFSVPDRFVQTSPVNMDSTDSSSCQ